ncbi:MAG: hypothetical protein GX620_00070 [Chloroflexi bacterium]|nr:hypothetical protein [Chloroflexota bacterium]
MSSRDRGPLGVPDEQFENLIRAVLRVRIAGTTPGPRAWERICRSTRRRGPRQRRLLMERELAAGDIHHAWMMKGTVVCDLRWQFLGHHPLIGRLIA